MRISDWSSDVCSSDLEREFREITGAEDEAAVLVRQAEQVISAQAGLHIFECDIKDGFAVGIGMTDIFEHSLGGRLDVDLFGGDAKRRHQLPSIALGRVAGREAWKGEAHDIGARPLKAVDRKSTRLNSSH